MSILEHLDELRRCLIHSIAAIFIGFLFCWYKASDIFHWLAIPALDALGEGEKLAYTGLVDPFFLYMKVAFIASIFLTSPYILYQLWRFIAPGLYPKERRMVVPFVFFSSLFFIGGGYFGYRVVFPLMCSFFIQLGEDFRAILTIREYLGLATRLLLGMGLVFELPILIYFLARLGLVSAGFLISKFKYAFLGIFLVAAVITPTPDVVTQTSLALPMIVLYWLGVGIALVFGKKEKEETEETGD